MGSPCSLAGQWRHTCASVHSPAFSSPRLGSTAGGVLPSCGRSRSHSIFVSSPAWWPKDPTHFAPETSPDIPPDESCRMQATHATAEEHALASLVQPALAYRRAYFMVFEPPGSRCDR